MPDTSETAQREAVEPSRMPRVRRPGLAAVQKCAEHACLIYAQLGVFSQLNVVPDSLAFFLLVSYFFVFFLLSSRLTLVLY